MQHHAVLGCVVIVVIVVILVSGAVLAPAGTVELEPDSMDPPGLRPFLEQFAAAVEAGDWARALQFFDPDNFAAQIELLEGDELQYIAEGMGLYGDGGSRGDALHAIETITVTRIEYDAEAELYTVTGTIALDDHRDFELVLFIVAADTEQGWMIRPAVG